MESYDVIVCGGGTAGMIAAAAAARTGARTLVVEREGYLGGTATYGIPFLGFFSGNGQQVVGGLAQKLVERMTAAGGCSGHVRGGEWKAKISADKAHEFSLTPFDPECLKYAAQEMVLESGADLLLHALLSGATVEQGRIRSIECMTVQGRMDLRATQYVDCSGDAMLAWMAGYPTEMRGAGHMQNVTSIIRVGNVDSGALLDNLLHSRGIRGLEDWHIRIVRGPLLGGREGIVHLAGHAEPEEGGKLLTFTAVGWRPQEMSFNITRTVDVDPTNAADITRAEIEERKNVHRVVGSLKKHIHGFADAFLLSTSTRVGIREGRRIRGLFTLSEEEVLSGSEFPDAIARGAYPIDIHDPKGGKTQFSFIRGGGSYGIPYRCLIPDGSQNLLVAGRCVSTTGKALGSVRLMPCCMALGQAAGSAAALAAAADVPPAELPIGRLRDHLLQQGEVLDLP